MRVVMTRNTRPRPSTPLSMVGPGSRAVVAVVRGGRGMAHRILVNEA